jgi:uncharacterized protein YcbK (DUF882 family)
MGDISKHFSRWEFACHCGCGMKCVDIKIIEILEQVREKFGKPVKIHCGCRCDTHNKTIPGHSEKSPHPKGLATDFSVKDTDPREVAKYINTLIPNIGGIGIYLQWIPKGIHLDISDGKGTELNIRPARWPNEIWKDM